MSRSTRTLLVRDQPLPRLRGVNSWRWRSRESVGEAVDPPDAEGLLNDLLVGDPGAAAGGPPRNEPDAVARRVVRGEPVAPLGAPLGVDAGTAAVLHGLSARGSASSTAGSGRRRRGADRRRRRRSPRGPRPSARRPARRTLRSTWSARLLPTSGMIPAPWASSQASDSAGRPTPLADAIASRRATTSRFRSRLPPWKRGTLRRQSSGARSSMRRMRPARSPRESGL